MTHCDGYRAAAVAKARDVLTIGIDAEPAAPLPAGVLDTIALPRELVDIRALAAGSRGIPWDRLLFSAKETVYKAWFPLTQTWLGFDEARISFSSSGEFTARLLVPGPTMPTGRLTEFTGRWLHQRGFVVCVIVLLA